MTCVEPSGTGRCPSCGGMSVARATELLTTPGARYSGSDWKYGWPHKFYISGPDGAHGKFYAKHLTLVPQEPLDAFAKLSRALLGVIYGRHEKGLWYRAPRDFQTWGVVGAERNTAETRADLLKKLEQATNADDGTLRAAMQAYNEADGRFGPPVPQWIREAPLAPPPDHGSEGRAGQTRG